MRSTAVYSLGAYRIGSGAMARATRPWPSAGRRSFCGGGAMALKKSCDLFQWANANAACGTLSACFSRRTLPTIN
jgi:hypothetical protein